MPVISLGASLQEGREEPIATMIARFLYGYLTESYPTCSVYIFDRERYPGMGDCYNKQKADMIAVGTDIAHHVHVDAYVPSAYGFSVLYDGRYNTYNFAVDIEHGLASALAQYIPQYTQDRGTSDRKDNPVAVLKMYATMSEVGFYTNITEYNMLLQQWYCAQVAWGLYLGMVEQIAEKFGISPVGKKEEEMPAFNKVETKKDTLKGKWQDVDVYGCLSLKDDATVYFYRNIPADTPVHVYVLPFDGEKMNKEWGSGGYDNKDDVHGMKMTLHDLFDKTVPAGWVTIHVPAGTVLGIGGVY